MHPPGMVFAFGRHAFRVAGNLLSGPHPQHCAHPYDIVINVLWAPCFECLQIGHGSCSTEEATSNASSSVMTQITAVRCAIRTMDEQRVAIVREHDSLKPQLNTVLQVICGHHIVEHHPRALDFSNPPQMLTYKHIVQPAMSGARVSCKA